MARSPATWKYVAVWLLAGFLGNIASRILSLFIYADVRSLDDVVSAMVIGIPVEAIVIGLVVIAAYSVFTSLDMSAVFPWMVGLVSLSALINLGIVASSGFAPGWVFAYQIACSAGMLFGIRAFFISKGRIA